MTLLLASDAQMARSITLKCCPPITLHTLLDAGEYISERGAGVRSAQSNRVTNLFMAAAASGSSEQIETATGQFEILLQQRKAL
jgi:hypothetical protein